MAWSKKVLSIKTWLWNSSRFAQSVCFCIRFLSIWFTCTKGLQVMQTIWNAQQEQFLWRQTTMWNVNYTTSMKDIVRIVHLPPVVKSEFYEATRILFVCKEKKKDFIHQFVSAGHKLLCQLRHIEQHTQFASSGYSPKCHYGNTEETNCWIKSSFYFSLHTKSVLVTS